MSNPYIANDRDIPFCSMRAFTLSGPQLARTGTSGPILRRIGFLEVAFIREYTGSV